MHLSLKLEKLLYLWISHLTDTLHAEMKYDTRELIES